MFASFAVAMYHEVPPDMRDYDHHTNFQEIVNALSLLFEIMVGTPFVAMASSAITT